ncbi:MAG: cobalamin-dependent protein, partial [Methanosarcinales archaeon]
MTKVLLVNPKLPSLSREGIVIPTGLLWIASYLKQNDCDIKIVNCHDQKNYKKIIKREINSSLYVGISVMTTQVNSALSISDFVKEIDNSIPIVWGGIHPTLFPEQTLSGRSIDTVVVGDGEDSSLKLVNNFKKGVLYSENFWM